MNLMLSILLTTAVAFFSYMIGQKSGWNAYRVIGESRRVTAETYKDMLYEALESRGRRVLRLHLQKPDDVGKIRELITN